MKIIPEKLEDYKVEHTEYYQKCKDMWNQCVNEAKNKKKSISNPEFAHVKKHLFNDKNIEDDENLVNEEEGWVYKGSVLRGELHGPGSKMMVGGQIMYESIWIKNEMINGYMLSFDESGNITQVAKCKKGVPIKLEK